MTPRGSPAERPFGLLVVQIDGLSRPLAEELIAAGRMPVLGRLIGSGQLVLDSWIPELPPCTPASQAGILHGRNGGVPGFRWFEKPTGRLMEANRPTDATEIARRVSDGHGLLAHDGASIGNLLTGDAPSSHLTLATIQGDPSGRDRSTRGGGYPRDLRVYARIAGLLLTDLAREMGAALTGEDRSDPLRSALRWKFLLQRVISTVPLRVLSTALVIGAMRRGRPIIYVDFTGHDEAGHSQGPRTGPALRAATSVDESIGEILRARRRAPRRYRLVVLSDHGQSWGETFAERHGITLEEVIATAMGPGTRYHGATLPTEYRDSGVRLAGHLWPGFLSVPAAALAERLRRYPRHTGTSGAHGRGERGSDDPARADVVVAASGNLAIVSFPQVPGRMEREAIEARWPGLIEAIAGHPGVGAVVVRTAAGPYAISGAGSHDLATGTIQGRDPLSVFGTNTVRHLQRLSSFDNAGDLLVLGGVDADGRVQSFEELAGSHGGHGGWQDLPFIAHPPDLGLAGPLVGAPALYHQLAAWMGRLGLPDPRVGMDSGVPVEADQGQPGEFGRHIRFRPSGYLHRPGGPGENYYVDADVPDQAS